MLRFLFEAAIKHDFPAHAIALDESISILADELAFHRKFDALHAFALVVEESQNMSKNLAIRVDANGVLLGKNTSQVLLLQLVQESHGGFLWNLAFQDDVFFAGGKPLKNLLLVQAKVF